MTIPAGSIPELDGVQPITAEMWFKTGWNGASDHWDYLLEWLEMGNGNGGMSIAVQGGRLQVYLKPWVDVCTVTGDTWYHIAVTKEPGHVRIYLNGQRVYTGTNPSMGPQETELALGCFGVPHRRERRQLLRLPARRDRELRAAARSASATPRSTTRSSPTAHATCLRRGSRRSPSW